MKKFKLMICIFFITLCCGCWDKHELEDQTFVVMMGIDKADDKNITLTVAFPATQTESGGNQGNAENSGDYSVMSVKAPSMVEALNMFSVKLAGPLSLFSAKTVVISQELAEEDMLRHVFSSWRYEQTRNNANVLISNCTAAEFINARLKKAAIDPLRQEDLLLEQANYSAYYKPVQFLDLVINLKSGSTDGTAMYGGIITGDENNGNPEENEPKETGNNNIDIKNPIKGGYFPGEVPLKADNASQICGLAVFRSNKMVGALDSLEAQTYAMMTKSKTRKILTLPDPIEPGGNIVVSVLPTGNSRISSYFIDDSPVFDIEVRLRCTIECVQNETDYTSDENYNLLTEYIRQACTQNMMNLMIKLQREYNADLLRLGDKLAYNFLTTRELENYNWPERYQDAEININVHLDIDRTGIFKP